MLYAIIIKDKALHVHILHTCTYTYPTRAYTWAALDVACYYQAGHSIYVHIYTYIRIHIHIYVQAISMLDAIIKNRALYGPLGFASQGLTYAVRHLCTCAIVCVCLQV